LNGLNLVTNCTFHVEGNETTLSLNAFGLGVDVTLFQTDWSMFFCVRYYLSRPVSPHRTVPRNLRFAERLNDKDTGIQHDKAESFPTDCDVVLGIVARTVTPKSSVYSMTVPRPAAIRSR
jgi:hypothetical protein